MRRIAFFAMLLVLGACICSCQFSASPGHGHGPPPHAHARGRRHAYVYYPSSYVYFDNVRGTYWYMAGGVWKATVALPSHITISKSEGVSIHVESDKPYEHFHAHKVKYPPGQLKKAKLKSPPRAKGKAKGKGKHKK